MKLRRLLNSTQQPPVLGSVPRLALSTSISVALGVLMGMSFCARAGTGKILRRGSGGSAGASGKGGVPTAGATDASVALQAAARAQDALSRVTQAVQSVQALQASARAAAATRPAGSSFGLVLPPVANGFAPGGLVVDPEVTYNGSLWTGAALPVQTGGSGGQVHVTVTQTQPQAVLNWESFNVGSKTTLQFDQSKGGHNAGKWVAINKVDDPSGRPSQILGELEAQGQVYVINRNGIVFGGASQVNLHGLVASSLPINDNLLQSGLLENPGEQFLFSALPTSLFQPTISDPPVTVTAQAAAVRLAQVLATGAAPVVRSRGSGAPVTLAASADYTTTVGADGHTVVNFTSAGLTKLAGAQAVVSYAPSVVKSGAVIVEQGALLTASSSAQHTGGRISLIGPVVENDGTIRTPDGQTILAAGLQVGWAAHAGADPSLRGLDTYVGAVAPAGGGGDPAAGTVVNRGFIDAERAEIALVGKSIEQLGVIHSTTSVSLNGRIDLLADYDAVSNTAYDASRVSSGLPFLSREAGMVTLGAGSATFADPELQSADTVAGDALALKSQVNVRGSSIRLEQNAAAIAPGGDISMQAGAWSYLGGAQPQSKFVFTGGQIYLEGGALISTAGSLNVPVAMAENLLSLQLRGPELADSPVQRDSLLRTFTLNVDLRRTGTFGGAAWVGTPLADLSGYLALIKRTAGELTTAGGTVTLSAGGSVVMQRGSLADVSGGWIDYQAGMVATSNVLYEGHVLNIADAPPDRVYAGLYTGTFSEGNARYGTSATFTNPLAPSQQHWEDAYRQGAAGGTLTLSAPSMALDGTLLGQTIAGPRQQAAAPAAAALSISFQAQRPLENNEFAYFSPAPPSVVFSSGASQAPAAPFSLATAGASMILTGDRAERVILSPALLSAGDFGQLTVNNGDGSIALSAGEKIAGPDGGSLTLQAANLSIFGSVLLPGGKVSLQASNISPYLVDTLLATPKPNAGRGMFTLGPEASIDVSGVVADERFGRSGQTLREAPAGGAIVIRAHRADLATGSTLDVSGGLTFGSKGQRTWGSGGSLEIDAGSDPLVAAVAGGTLELGATLTGFSGTVGGALTVQAGRIQIGGASAPVGVLQLTPDFFSEGGFSSFTLNALGTRGGAAITIAPGTVIAPVAQSLVAMPLAEGLDLRLMTLPAEERAPVSLTFNAKGIRDLFLTNPLVVRGDFVMGAGARIDAGLLGNVSISGDTAAVLGSINAPGGSISIAGGMNSLSLFQGSANALVTVELGSGAQLSTAGITVYTPDRFGRLTGEVLPGGSIAVSGNLFAAAGSRLDVSGTSAMPAMAPAMAAVQDGSPLVPAGSGLTTPLFASLAVSRRVASDAGSIVLRGGQELFSQATLLGAAGGASASGGTLSISSGRLGAAGVTDTPLDPTLLVTPGSELLSTAGIGQTVRLSDGSVAAPLGHFAVSSFTNSGFDSLALGGTVEFAGGVSIQARRELSIADGVIISDGATFLAAPHVKLGQTFTAPLQASEATSVFTSGGNPFHLAATAGQGTLTVQAELIDVGNLSLQHTGQLHLLAPEGDIRGDGTLSAAGAVTLRAGQIYPTTGSTFTIAANSVVVEAGSEQALPWSAGGTLNIYAAHIVQDGTLRAPLGTIHLGWDGTGTAPVNAISGVAVAATQNVTLGAGSMTSVSMVDPATGNALTLPYGFNPLGSAWIDPAGRDISTSGLPAKTVQIAGIKVTEASGATIDLRGGGDLYAFRFGSGSGGSTDLLGTANAAWSAGATYAAGTLVSYHGQTWSARTESTGQAPGVSTSGWRLVPQAFAVIPSYGSAFAPYAPFNTSTDAANLAAGNSGYAQSGLEAGDRIYLAASGALAAGTYTLLPARYALLPGAVLVTPQAGTAFGTVNQADGSDLVAGYRFNGLNAAREGTPLVTKFEVASGDVLRQRANYQDFFANTFFAGGAQRLPEQAGYLSFSAVSALTLRGGVASQGGLIDISTQADLAITATGAADGQNGIVLSAAVLDSFGAESLLIGGLRSFQGNNATVQVNTARLTVDNAGQALTAPEVVLAARGSLTLDSGAQIVSSGATGTRGTLSVTGDGALVRVSGDPAAKLVRTGQTGSLTPDLSVGAGAELRGASVTLDSTAGTSLDATAHIHAGRLALGSGQITIALNDAVTLPPAPGLLLTGPLLSSLQHTESLSLLSYSTLDTYGSGRIALAGNSTLALHAGQIRGFETGGGDVTFAAGKILLDNSAGSAAGANSAQSLSGSLVLSAGTITLGANATQISQFAKVQIDAAKGVLFKGVGSLSTVGAITIETPGMTGAAGAQQALTAGGALVLNSAPGTPIVGGPGAQLSLTGQSIVENTALVLPSGNLSLHATGGDLTVGGSLDVSGHTRNFFDLIKGADAGTISLRAENGNVTLSAGSTVSVAAAGGGKPGVLSVSVPQGTLSLAGTLKGGGGSFSLDASVLPSLAAPGSAVTAGDFTGGQSFRVRSGDVAVDGALKTHSFTLSADDGSITVTGSGSIDASGVTGGSIGLQATGSVTLESGAKLTAAGDHFDAAGKGGAISLEAGSERNGVVSTTAMLDVQAGSTIDLSVAAANPGSAAAGQFTGTLHLRAPQTADGTDLQMSTIGATIPGASQILVEGYKVYTPAGGIIDAGARNAVLNDGQNFTGEAGTSSAGYTAMRDRLLAGNTGLSSQVRIEAGAEIISLAGDLTLGASWDLSGARFGPESAPGVLTLRAAGNLVFPAKVSLSDGFAGSSAYGLWGRSADGGRQPVLVVSANGRSGLERRGFPCRATAGRSRRRQWLGPPGERLRRAADGFC